MRRRELFLIFFLGSLTPALVRAGEPVDIVFNLTGTLVQQVPLRERSTYEASRVVAADGRLYRMADGSAEAIEVLASNPDVRLSVFSRLPRAETSHILAAMSAGAGHPSTASLVPRVLGAEDLTVPVLTAPKSFKDLTKIPGLDPKQAILIDDDPEAAGPGGHVLSTGKSYWAFEKFEDAARKPASADVPATREEWQRDRNRMLLSLGAVSKALQDGTEGFADRARKIAADELARPEALLKAANAAIARAASAYYDFSYAYGDGPPAIQGCVRRSLSDPKLAEPVADFGLCMKFAKSHPSWWGEDQHQCARLTEADAFLALEDPAVCARAFPTHHRWLDESLSKCGLFNQADRLVREVPRGDCADANTIACDPTSGTFTSAFHAQIKGIRTELLPQILSLKDGETVPPALALDAAASKLVAMSMVARLHKTREIPTDAPASAIPLMEHGQIQMFFHEQDFDSIQQNCFLNQHQTGASTSYRVSQNRPKRARYEDLFAGVKVESTYDPNPANPAHNLRPKYAFLGFDAPVADIAPEYGSLYGEIAAVMKPEVKQRSTFTADDSMLGYEWLQTLPRSFAAKPASVADVMPPTRNPAASKVHYWEAQIWGKTCFDDVDYFLIGCFKAIQPETLEKIKASGIPVYQCKMVIDAFGQRLLKGKLLSAGNTAVRK